MYAKDQITINDRREMLRVKLKSLAAEARIIRHETARLQRRKYREVRYTDHRGIERVRRVAYDGRWGPLQQELRAHRLSVVRDEARHTGIAFALIRGKSIDSIERPATWGKPGYAAEPDWERVRKMMKRYGQYGPAGLAEPECMRTALKIAA